MIRPLSFECAVLLVGGRIWKAQEGEAKMDTQRPTKFNSDAILKHLEFIQNIVTRMARNSFLLKGWSVTLVAAIFVLTVNNPSVYLVIIAIFPALAFWGLDAYYLRQERLFRQLYKKVSEEPDNVNAFSMDTSGYERSVQSWFGTVLSKSVLPFHGIVVGTVALATIVLLLVA